MTKTLILFSGADPAALFVEDGVVVARGPDALAQERAEARLVLIASASEVALHHAELSGLKPAQARAAAQLLLAEQSLLPPGTAHFAVSDGEDEGATVVAIASNAAMADWIADHDPDVILPAALLLPRAEDGFVRGQVGGEWLLRGAGFAFPDDEVVAPLLVGSQTVAVLDASAVETTIMEMAAAPLLNIRQGAFAKKQDWTPAIGSMRLIATAAAVLVFLSLAIPVVEMVRLNWRTSAIEETAQSRAQAALGDASPPEDAVGALDQRLATYRGGGAGFAATMAATAQAIRATPNAELTSASFRSDGALAVTARLTIADEARLLQDRLRANGLIVTAKPFNPSQSPPVIELEVRGQ